ncbi:MAG: class I SAM-dependent methyltransferase [Pseudonocardia sediminis]
MSESERPEAIRPATVHRAYGRRAAGFDGFLKTIPGYHAHLRMSTNRMGLRGGSALRLLDVGCGTGASTAALLDAAPGATVVAVDASTEMIAVARKKNWPPHVEFVHTRLETLAEAGVHGPFDGIFAAYLVSNLPDAEIGLRRLLSLLKPGAPLAVHDYAVADRMGSRMRWSLASWSYLIPMARIRSGSAELQRYRTQRVHSTDGVEAMTHRMGRAGFEDVRVQTVPGWQQHVVHTFLGRRPDEPDVVGQRRAARAAAEPQWAGLPEAPANPEEAGEEAAVAPEEEGGPEDRGYAEPEAADGVDGVDASDTAAGPADPEAPTPPHGVPPVDGGKPGDRDA